MYNYGAYTDQYVLDPAYAEDLDDLYTRLAQRDASRPAYVKARQRHMNTMNTLVKNNRARQSGNANLGNIATNAAGVAADVAGDVAADAAMDTVSKGGDLKGFFANAKSGAGNALKNVKAGKGINPKFAKGATGITAALAAVNAIKGISDYNTEMKNSQDVANDILASASANPNLRYDLTSDQLKMLRQLRNGTYDLSGDLSGASILSGLGNTAIGAGTGFLTGGWGGAIAGGLGGLVDSALGGMQDNQRRITSELEGLYQALYESEMRNKSMERNAAMQRYANGLY